MYQARARLAPRTKHAAPDAAVQTALWEIFVAIGTFWKLTDTADDYRCRFEAFVTDRLVFNSLYRDFYAHAANYLTTLKHTAGSDGKAYAILFTQKAKVVPAALTAITAVPQNELDFVQTYVVNEFIALRITLGGFKDFGASHTIGFPGGANIEGRAPSYRVAKLP
jgi:hypothetical protein